MWFFTVIQFQDGKKSFSRVQTLFVIFVVFFVKVSAGSLHAFESPNLPPLATVGIDIGNNLEFIQYLPTYLGIIVGIFMVTISAGDPDT